jgi:hypothetical protein
MKTIYTAIFGNYDTLKEPFVVTEGWRYICFTDQDFKSDTWDIVKTFSNQDRVKTARLYKICGFQYIDSEFSMWIDGTFVINCDLNKWWRQFRPPFTTVRHPYDDCAYQDAKNCLRMGKGEPDSIKKQIENYRNAGMPDGNGLIASGILMRQNTPEVVDFCEKWWSEVEKNSSRDQLSFAYADFLMPGRHKSISYSYLDRTEFIHVPHIEKIKRFSA